MTEKKQQHKKKRGKVQHIRGSPKKRKILKVEKKEKVQLKK